jgi:hypothetical protein
MHGNNPKLIINKIKVTKNYIYARDCVKDKTWWPIKGRYTAANQGG